MEALIRQHFGDDAPEIPKITEVLKRVIPLCDDRNLLAHGTWWEFNPGTGTITVARGTTRPGERANVSFTVHQIEAIASRIQDAEAELWHLKRAIENRHPRGYV